MAEQQYWVRTEQGMVWGPYPRPVLERLRGRLNERCQISTDGSTFRPGSEHPELAELLCSAEETPPATRIDTPSSVARVSAPPPPEPIAPPVEAPALEVPAEGDLTATSAARLYALAAATSASGWLQIHTEKGALLQISFRRGTPEQVSSDDPELSILRFLTDRKAITPDQAHKAEEHRAAAGTDAVTALFALQLIAPADAHRVLGEHALFVLDRVLATWRGKFEFERDAPSPPGAYPLGNKWALLAESVRRLDAAVLRARLGQRLQRRVQRSGGMAVGQVDELKLNAQEARLYAGIDGTRTGDELLSGLPDAAVGLRLLHLLVELGHLSFDEHEPVQPKPPPRAAEPPKAAPTPGAPAGKPSPTTSVAKPAPAAAKAAPQARPLPPIARPAPPVGAPRPTPSAVKPAPRAEPPKPAAPPEPRKPPPTIEELRAVLQRFEKADHFAVLNLERKATAADAKRAFFQLAREYHPDTVPPDAPAELRVVKQALFARVNEASDVLTDEARRKEYEKELAGEAKTVDVGNIFAAEDAFNKAELMIKAKKFAEGLEAIEEAIRLYPDEGEFYAWRAWAVFMLAKDRRAAHAGAVADCKKALELNPRSIPAWLFQGQMSKIVGDLKAAEGAFNKVLEIDEKNIEAQRELRYLWPGKKG